jgi:hypothetical protein
VTEPARSRSARHALRPPHRRATRSRRRRKAAASATLVLATLSLSSVAASGDALPGDPLYGLKRKVQGVEMVLARGDVDRGHRHLELARTRVRELDTAGVSARPGALVSALDDMDGETRIGVRLLSTAAVRRTDEGRLTELSAWTSEQRDLLSAASTRLPDAARARAADSFALLGTVSTRVASLRGWLHCACPAAEPVDDLGPQPCTSGCGTPLAVTPVQPTARPGSRTVSSPAAGVPDAPHQPHQPHQPPSAAAGAQPAPAPIGADSAPTARSAPIAGPPGPDPRRRADRTPSAPGQRRPSAPDPTAPPPVPDVLAGLLGLLGALGSGG